MRALHAAIIVVVSATASVQAEDGPFTYQCKGNSRIMPSGLALGKVDWKFDIEPGKKQVVAEGKTEPIEIDRYRISFPMEGNHWISITRSNGRFNVVKPIRNPDRKMPEYLFYEGKCERLA
jgi:hypothetical protein